jgi:hypothetical protein
MLPMASVGRHFRKLLVAERLRQPPEEIYGGADAALSNGPLKKYQACWQADVSTKYRKHPCAALVYLSSL